MSAHDSLHTDPLLAEVSELLHRMQMCKTLAPFQWMASDAIRKLQAYEKKLETTSPSICKQE